MPEDDVTIAQRQHRRWDLARDHLGWPVVEILIMRRVAGIAYHEPHPGATSRTPAALGIVIRAGRNIAQHHRVEPADVNPHLQRR